MVKGIRVNLLAKELGVESKAILHKLREEGLGDKAPNHMSTLSAGLAESVREWFSGSAEDSAGGGTAVETVQLATRKTAKKTKKKEETDEESTGDEVVITEAPAPDAAPAVIEEPEAPVIPPPEIIEPPVSEAAPPPAHLPPPVIIELPPAPPIAPPIPPAIPAPAPLAPAAIVAAPPPPPPATPAAPPAPPAVHAPDHGRTSRPTVTLASRSAAEQRAPVVQAPQLTKLQPAKIQGPRVVRIEKEETVDNRGPRQARPTGGGDSGSTTTPAAPRGGRGVRVSEDDEAEEAKKKAAKNAKSLSSRRRGGVDGRRGEAMEKLKEFTDADLIARRDALNAAASSRNVFDSHLRQIEKRGTHTQSKPVSQRGEPVSIQEPITVRSLAAALQIKSSELISRLMRQGVIANINQSLDATTAGALALDLGVELNIAPRPTMEETLLKELDSQERDPKNMHLRPPVVTILGHVDHGKTSLLDRIRSANVAAGESGGITQHVGAWMVQLGKWRVTFVDTPGHQAFTAMRARGAKMTDLVVLVVSAAEGVQPQTVESINHARAANVPIIVALNKIDRADANPDMVLGQLAKEGLNPREWGGDTEVVRVSAITGQGVPELIEVLDLQSQIMELKADATVPARGLVIESRMDEGLGPVATVLIQEGTLKIGDIGLSGNGFGRIRSLWNDRGESIREAGPSTPVIVSGLGALPDAGERFFALDDLDRARTIAEERQGRARQDTLAGSNRVTLETLAESMKAEKVKTINLIIKGDVQGSVETLAQSVTGDNTSEVRVRVIHSGVGPINESDVELADASKAVIIGFHVAPEETARQMAGQRRVEIRLYRVIYEIFDDLKKALSGLLEPEVREKHHGRVEIRKVFKVSKIGTVAGCFVTEGHVQRGSRIRLIRDGNIIVEDLSLESLRRVKDDVREVKAGLECGIKVAGYDDLKVGDVLDAYIRETVQRTL